MMLLFSLQHPLLLSSRSRAYLINLKICVFFACEWQASTGWTMDRLSFNILSSTYNVGIHALLFRKGGKVNQINSIVFALTIFMKVKIDTCCLSMICTAGPGSMATSVSTPGRFGPWMPPRPLVAKAAWFSSSVKPYTGAAGWHMYYTACRQYDGHISAANKHYILTRGAFEKLCRLRDYPYTVWWSYSRDVS